MGNIIVKAKLVFSSGNGVNVCDIDINFNPDTLVLKEVSINDTIKGQVITHLGNGFYNFKAFGEVVINFNASLLGRLITFINEEINNNYFYLDKHIDMAGKNQTLLNVIGIINEDNLYKPTVDVCKDSCSVSERLSAVEDKLDHLIKISK